MFENMTTTEASKILMAHDPSNNTDSTVYVPEIILDSVGLPSPQTIGVCHSNNFTLLEATAWLVYHTQPYEKLRQRDPYTWSYTVAITECDKIAVN